MMKRLTFLLGLLPALAAADIGYQLTVDPAAGQVRVAVTVPNAGENPVFRIPAWCPGFYFLIPYHAKISDVRATDEAGATLKVTSLEASSWQVNNPAGGPVTISYAVLGDDPGLGFFGVNVRKQTAFVNGPAAFMYCEGRKEEAAKLKIRVPSGWDVATAMDQLPDGDYSSVDYDALLDHPIDMGKMERRKFTVENIPFEAVFTSPDGIYRPNLDAVAQELQRLSKPAIQMFGGAPFKKYMYHIHLAVGGFGGGLEHRASTVIATPNSPGLQLGTLAAHEFFHVWNVKNIRPIALGPFDYTKQVRTRTLWFNEGVTDYYADITAYRAESLDVEGLLQTFTFEIASHQAGKTRLSTPVEEACKNVWEHGGFQMGDLNYYTTGKIMGLLFDAAIRDATDGKQSLDDVMRLLFQKHKLPKPGYDDDGLRNAISLIAGKDLGPLYDQIARTTKEFPYELLNSIGIRVIKPGDTVPSLAIAERDGKVSWTSDAAAAAGVEVGDTIVNVDGKPFAPGVFQGTEEGVTLKLSRDNKPKTVKLRNSKYTASRWSVELDPFASTKAIRLREQWLRR